MRHWLYWLYWFFFTGMVQQRRELRLKGPRRSNEETAGDTFMASSPRWSTCGIHGFRLVPAGPSMGSGPLADFRKSSRNSDAGSTPVIRR